APAGRRRDEVDALVAAHLGINPLAAGHTGPRDVHAAHADAIAAEHRTGAARLRHVQLYARRGSHLADEADVKSLGTGARDKVALRVALLGLIRVVALDVL